jgi:hypothetical protein
MEETQLWTEEAKQFSEPVATQEHTSQVRQHQLTLIAFRMTFYCSFLDMIITYIDYQP